MNDIDDGYRRASAQDSSEPSESTRQNILAHAARLAAQRAAGKEPASSPDFRRPAANQPSWRPALVGTLAAAGLAGLLMTPLFLPPRAPNSTGSMVPDAGRATSKHATENEKDQPALPAAKILRTAPAAPPNFVPQEALSAGVPSAADSSRHEYAAPLAPGASRNFVAPETSAVFGAGASNSLAQRSAAPRAIAAAPLSAAALQRAADAGDNSRLQALLATPTDINVRDVHGRTALMLAVMGGQAGAVNVLLAYGADANAADADGITPLRAALAGAQPAIASALQRAGAH